MIKLSTSLLVRLATCGLLFTSTSCSLTVKSSLGSGSEQTAGDASAAEVATDHSEGVAPSSGQVAPAGADAETAVAQKALRLLLGDAHQVSGYDGDDPEARRASGTFAFESKKEHDRLESKIVAIVEKQSGASFRQAAQHAACVERLVNEESRTPKQAQNDCRSKTGAKFGLAATGPDVYLRGIYLLHMLEALGDPEAKKPGIERYVRSLGHRVETFRIEVSDSKYGLVSYTLAAVPPAEWPQTRLRYAIDFAKKHGASPEVVKELELASTKAPKTKCVSRPYVIYQEHEGGGRYGAMGVDTSGYRSSEDVPCSRAASSDPNLLRLFQQRWEGPGTVKAVRPISGESWRVIRSPLGEPTEKRRTVEVVLQIDT